MRRRLSIQDRKSILDHEPSRRPRRRYLPIGLLVITLVLAIGLVWTWWSPRLFSSSRTPLTQSQPYGTEKRKIDSSKPFKISRTPLPVHHLHKSIHFHNTPVSKHRPSSNQFFLPSEARFDYGNSSNGEVRSLKGVGHVPLIGIVTATNNPREHILETAKTVFGQSLQDFIWVIVDDHTTNGQSLSYIAQIVQQGQGRVVVLKNTGDNGLAKSRNVGLDFLIGKRGEPPEENRRKPTYLVSLDDDDLFEFTALEKTVWMLEGNPDWGLGGFHFIKFGAVNETVNKGLHSDSENFMWGNYVPNAAVYRSSAVLSSGCRYDEINFLSGGEDWDFWLCLAESGFWGGTIPEPLFWYRSNDQTFRSQRWGSTFTDDGVVGLRQRMKQKHADLGRSFPIMRPRRSVALEPISWQLPFESYLGLSEKSIMFVLPWLYRGGADMGALHMIQLYAEEGYRVTVICTLYSIPAGIELKPWVLQYTHDLFILPSFLRASEFPRFIKYLVRSRGINQIIMSNSQLLYEMLPSLAEQLPDVKIVDYLHNEAYDGWKSGGYPQYSLIMQRYLARTITCSHYLRDWLLDRGHFNSSRIGVVKLGIDSALYQPIASELDRENAKDQLLQIDPDTIVISVIARLDPQKRSTMIPYIASELLQMVDEPFQLVMIGDGPMRESVNIALDKLDLHDVVRLEGTQQHPEKYLKATDIFLLPSLSEGISIAVTEAMFMGLPIVTANAGALPEQIGHGSDTAAGILVEQTATDERVDAILYAEALAKLINNPKIRRKYGRNARRLTQDSVDWRVTLKPLFEEMKLAENIEERIPGMDRLHKNGLPPNPAASLAIQTLLLEQWEHTDFLGHYGKALN